MSRDTRSGLFLRRPSPQPFNSSEFAIVFEEWDPTFAFHHTVWTEALFETKQVQKEKDEEQLQLKMSAIMPFNGYRTAHGHELSKRQTRRCLSFVLFSLCLPALFRYPLQ